MNAKKIVTAGLALVMVAGISVAGTLAYLTSNAGSVTNTFTVGNVAITLQEHAYSQETGALTDEVITASTTNTVGNNYGMINPGVVYDKDPYVTVAAGSENCYVFVKVVNGLGNKEAASVEGGYQTIEDQILDKEWTKYADGVYYKANQAAGAELEIFDHFCVSGDVTSDEGLEDIVIKAAAVQYAGFEDDVAGAYAEVSDFLA